MSIAVAPTKVVSVPSRIASVIDRENLGAPLPLALTRFASSFGVTRPTVAMKIAVHHLHERVATPVRRESEVPISVKALCRACDVTLEGAELLSSRRDRRWAGYSRAMRHRGQIVFKGARASISVPSQLGFAAARMSIAHELGHYLIHSASSSGVTSRLSTSGEEEILAEYGGRLMLMPLDRLSSDPTANLAEVALAWAQTARTSLHSAVERLGDPDVGLPSVRGAILWGLLADAPRSTAIADRLTPRWHLCQPAFVPVGKSKARAQSVIANAAAESSTVAASAVEHVRIGTFEGLFRIDVVSWGSRTDGTRTVLSTFSTTEYEATNGPWRNRVHGSEQLELI
jgi:hypothetical protein